MKKLAFQFALSGVLLASMAHGEKVVSQTYTQSGTAKTLTDYYYLEDGNGDTDNLVDSTWTTYTYGISHQDYYYTNGLLDSIRMFQDSIPDPNGGWQAYENLNWTAIYTYDEKGRMTLDSGVSYSGGAKNPLGYTRTTFLDDQSLQIDSSWSVMPDADHTIFLQNKDTTDLDSEGTPLTTRITRWDANKKEWVHDTKTRDYQTIAGKKVLVKSVLTWRGQAHITMEYEYDSDALLTKETKNQANGSSPIVEVTTYTYSDIVTPITSQPQQIAQSTSLQVSAIAGAPLALTITSSKAGVVTGGIFNINGRQVASITPTSLKNGKVSLSVDGVKGLSKGIYFANITVAGQVMSAKFTLK